MRKECQVQSNLGLDLATDGRKETPAHAKDTLVGYVCVEGCCA